MLKRLDDEFGFHATALDLRARRQEVLASNIANADTPGYKARDVDFRRELAAALSGAPRGAEARLVRTSARHLGAGGPGGGAQALLFRVPAQASVDGNTVEMDAERARFAENALHYEASVTLLNMQIRKLLAAIQG
ncbi:MAG: flagellar basal body rod protein FlgB [Burkholderiales bacterium]|nr:flagellar basal body rod protein FlgB [Burkholderiales bacterium]